MSDQAKSKASEGALAEGATSEAADPHESAQADVEDLTAKRPWIGGLMIAVGAITLFAIWSALPSRWWPVDLVGTCVAALSIIAGIGLLRGAPWAHKLGRASAGFSLAVGLIATSLLAFTASGLWGLYGPVGQGGAVLLFFIALVVLPYFVFLPAAHLYALRSGRPTT